MLDQQQFEQWALGTRRRRGRPRSDDDSPRSWRRGPADSRPSGRAVSQRPRFEFTPTRLVEIRLRTRLSQVEFASLLNVSVGTVRNWEQGRRKPTGAAQSLICIVDRDAPLALRALRIPIATKCYTVLR